MIPCCCRESLQRVCMSRKAKKHVIDKHFDPNAFGISIFYPHISLRLAFETFKAKLCAGILEGEVVHDYGHSHSDPPPRLIYYCPFDYVVGTFPMRQLWRIKNIETCYVRAVFATSRCSNPFCHRLVPSLLITIFPDESISY